jgi:hypothetical protein
MGNSMPESHPSWCARSHQGNEHVGPATHLLNRWAAPGRGTTVDLVDVGAHGEFDAVIRVRFDGERLAPLFTPTEARKLAQVLMRMADRADDN